MTTERQTILETPFASLWYYPGERIVHHQVHKYIFGPALRELLTTGADVLNAHGATKWLSDDRNGGAMSGEDKAWADVHWTPRIATQWRTWAIVPPDAVFGRMSIRRIAQEKRMLGVDVRLFDSPGDALAWLVAPPGPGGARRAALPFSADMPAARRRRVLGSGLTGEDPSAV